MSDPKKEENPLKKPPDPGVKSAKVMKLKKIKQRIEIKKGKGRISAVLAIRTNAFSLFNNVKNKKLDDEERVLMFYQAKKTIRQWTEKDAKVDSKKVFQLAKSLLTEEEFEVAGWYADDAKVFKYIPLLGLLDGKMKVIEEGLIKGEKGVGDEDGVNDEFYDKYGKIYKDLLDKDGGEEMNIDNEELVDENIEAAKKQFSDWEGFGEVEWNAEMNKIDPKVSKEEKKDEEKIDYEKEYDERIEDEKIIDAYIKEIEAKKVDLVDNKLNQKFFDDLNKKREEMKSSLNEAIENLKSNNKSDLTNEQLLALRNEDIKNVNWVTMDQAVFIVNELKNTCNTRETSFLFVIIRLLMNKIDSLEKVVKNLTNSLNQKVEIDENHVMKEKGNLQMKKIFKGDYIPQVEWNKLSNIDKAMHNVRDFAQYPKPSIWKNFNEKEKLEFFEEKLKWNRDRAKFLRQLAEGKMVDKELMKWKWNANISLSRAITCNLYYGDKFSDGFKVKEFQELWKKSNSDLRKETNMERMKLKGVLRKLNEKKKIQDAFVYVENWFVKLDGLYWENNLEALKDKAWRKYENNKKYYESKKFGTFLEKKRMPEAEVPIDIGAEEKNFA